MLFLVFMFLAFSFLKIVLSLLQISYVKKMMNSEPVVLSHDEYLKAGEISQQNEYFSIFSTAFNIVSFLFLVFFALNWFNGALPNSDNPFLKDIIFVMYFLLFQYFINLPLDIYEKFVKNKNQGFSSISVKTFFLDHVKSLILTIVFGGLIVYLLLYVMSIVGDLWWILGFICLFFVILITNLIYPTIIAPLFNKITPLQDTDLDESISKLLASCNFKSSGVFVIDASKRDSRLNAYFGGLGSSKRVVLFDTLIQKLSKNEILAVLGHELGHFKNHDIFKMIILSAVMMFSIFFIFGNIPNSIYDSFGISGNGAVLVFLLLFSPIVGFLFTPIIGFFSRQNEFNADKHAVSVQNKDDMISALRKLASENKSFPYSHFIYSFVYHTHPSLVERIKELESQ